MMRTYQKLMLNVSWLNFGNRGGETGSIWTQAMEDDHEEVQASMRIDVWLLCMN